MVNDVAHAVESELGRRTTLVVLNSRLLAGGVLGAVARPAGPRFTGYLSLASAEEPLAEAECTLTEKL